jgi:hypothetical protein
MEATPARAPQPPPHTQPKEGQQLPEHTQPLPNHQLEPETHPQPESEQEEDEEEDQQQRQQQQQQQQQQQTLPALRSALLSPSRRRAQSLPEPPFDCAEIPSSEGPDARPRVSSLVNVSAHTHALRPRRVSA